MLCEFWAPKLHTLMLWPKRGRERDQRVSGEYPARSACRFRSFTRPSEPWALPPLPKPSSGPWISSYSSRRLSGEPGQCSESRSHRRTWNREGPFEYLSSIVAQELRSGARGAADRRALERHVLSVYERVGRIITPPAGVWNQSGDVLAAMTSEGLELARVSKSFSNDILLALSCGHAGCVLITENYRDFSRIQKFARFEFIPPGPSKNPR